MYTFTDDLVRTFGTRGFEVSRVWPKEPVGVGWGRTNITKRVTYCGGGWFNVFRIRTLRRDWEGRYGRGNGGDSEVDKPRDERVAVITSSENWLTRGSDRRRSGHRIKEMFGFEGLLSLSILPYGRRLSYVERKYICFHVSGREIFHVEFQGIQWYSRHYK